MKPTTKYAKNSDVNIAYQVIGQGSVDFIFIPGWVSNIDMMWVDVNEYKLFFNKNRKAFEDQEHMCLIKFNTKIINLYLHLPTYEKTLTKKIHVDSKIITR